MKASSLYSTSSLPAPPILRSPLVGVRLLDLGDLSRTHLQAPVVASSSLSRRWSARFSFNSLSMNQDLELRQPVQLHFQDGVRLLLGQLEALDQLLRRVLLSLALADDLEHLVEAS